jgi:hypothetical protein
VRLMPGNYRKINVVTQSGAEDEHAEERRKTLPPPLRMHVHTPFGAELTSVFIIYISLCCHALGSSLSARLPLPMATDSERTEASKVYVKARALRPHPDPVLTPHEHE